MFEKQIFLKKWKKYFCAKRSVYLREMRNYPRQLGKKYFFQKYWFFTFHTEFSKFVLLEVLQWSQLLTPIRVGVMSSYSQMWKGDGHTTVRVRALLLPPSRALVEISSKTTFLGVLGGGSERCARSPYPTYAGELIILLPTVATLQY